MSRIIPLEIHDRINNVEYLLDALFMAAGDIDDRRQVNAIQRVIELALADLREVERQLEAIDEGGQA